MTNLSESEDTEYLSDGITESLINKLSTLPGLRVIPRSTAFYYKGKDTDMQTIGRDLDVKAILTGRVLQRGDRLNIQAELIDVAQASQIRGDQYNRNMTDIFEMQEQIALDIAEAMRLQLSVAEETRLAERDTDPLFEALEDSDPRIQISAIQGLTEFGGADVEEMLFWHFSHGFDRRTFPTLVEALSKFGDQRIIKPVFERMASFPSKAIRLQLLNSVCRTIGANGQFYQFLSLEEHKRYEELEDELEEAIKVLADTRALPEDTQQSIGIMYQKFKEAHEEDDTDGMMSQGRMLSALIRDTFHPEEQNTFDTLSVYLTLMTIDQFINSSAHKDLPAVQEIFLVVCLARVAGILKS